MPLSYSMLIVEGNQDQREQWSRRFLSLGYDVVAVFHPRQALSAATVKPFHVAIIDSTLPEMDGVALMQRLKRMTMGLKVILMTPQNQREAALDALTRGAFDCLMHPCRLSELERVVEEAIETFDDAPRAPAVCSEDTVIIPTHAELEAVKD